LKSKFKSLFEQKNKAAGTPTSETTSERVQYSMPEPVEYDLYDLDPLSKRKVTICNLFANHEKTVTEIAELLETSRKLVIDTLVENKLLKDRRQSPRPHTPAPEEISMK
jgi:hypothetical protein